MTPDWISDDGSVRLYCGDCLQVLPELSGVDAVVTDPPYGISHVKGRGGRDGAYRGKVSAAESRHHKPIIGDDKPFDPAPLFAFDNVLMFGANHYAKRLPDGGRWLAWNKLETIDPFDSFSDVEFMWHSTGGKASRICNYMWKGGLACRKLGENNGRREHPTQKPIGLMKWCLEQTRTEVGATILDPYMGSGSTGVACVQTGRKFIGIELDPGYFEIAKKRIQKAIAEKSELLIA